MKIHSLAAMLLCLSACQPDDTSAPEAAAAPTSEPSAADVIDTGGLVAAAAVPDIAGTWQPYSDGAESEFGVLTIAPGTLFLAAIGTAGLEFEGDHALLAWQEDYPALEGVCPEGPPAVVEFRRSDKSEFLAQEETGELLELSFYSSADNLAAGRDNNLDLCRISSWSRG